MSTTCTLLNDVAFAASAETMQMRKSSCETHARVEEYGAWQTRITPDLAEFIEAQTSIFLATANVDAQPHIQYRGGPIGFLSVLNDKTLSFPDLVGNCDHVTQGNLAVNPKAHIFLIDYAHRRRVTIWGEARVVDDDEKLAAKLMSSGHKARAEQAIVFSISVWDADRPLESYNAARPPMQQLRLRSARSPARPSKRRRNVCAPVWAK